ncbi:hypothetical protein IEQ34_006232 [Dendrobium chrysotoxum]|uniref:60S ribosomal protein L29 n=1 Tax=Dendrobium chrysotoxum TaxID=161865 RepID=A0AAV7HEC8_DENCH|nr:hypothetical protein IEQ34_006232 [Dendrobium chrysotoxum]
MESKIAARSSLQMKKSHNKGRNIRRKEKTRRKPMVQRGQVNYRITALAMHAISSVIWKAT